VARFQGVRRSFLALDALLTLASKRGLGLLARLPGTIDLFDRIAKAFRTKVVREWLRVFD